MQSLLHDHAQTEKKQSQKQIGLQILSEGGACDWEVAAMKLRISIDQQISMCGKKSNARQGGQEQPRKQFLDSSLFYYEYLNNSLNYILSGSNDLDHSIQFDTPALKQILSTDATEESVHFVERVKLMKTACDPGSYLKDVQEYGEFINYEAFRTSHQENAGIEAELQEEFEIGIKLKRIKKKFKRNDDRLTLCQIDMLDRQMKAEILAGFVEQIEGRAAEVDNHLDENRLYREMFNIQEVIKKEEKVEKNEKMDFKKEKPRKGPKRTKSDAYIPPSSKYRELIPNSQLGRIGEDRVKKEQSVQKYPIRIFPTTVSNLIPFNLPQRLVPPPASIFTPTIPPAPLEVPVPKMPVANPNPAPIPPPQIEAKTIQNIQEQPIKIAKPIEMIKPVELIKPVEIIKPVEMIIEKPVVREQIANPASSMTSSAQPNIKTDLERKKRKQKYIEKEEKSEKGRKRGPRQKMDKEKPERQKRAYRKRQQSAKPEEVRYSIPPPMPIPTQNLHVEKRTNQIGIQADANEDFQNLKVIAPRNVAFVFEPLRSAAPLVQPSPLERRQPLPERRQISDERLQQSISLNRSINLLGTSREMGERFRSVSPARMDIEAREIPGARTPAPAAYDSLRKSSEAHDRKPQDFDDISDYLI